MPTLSQLLRQFFPFTPTSGQEELFEHLNTFLISPQNKAVFLLKGYAGTGKTTVISTLRKILHHFEYKTLLLAPTGRAAKIMSLYSQKKAFTIHKVIFKYDDNLENPNLFNFKRQTNTYKNTLFIVDEASMIDDSPSIHSKGLLSELLNYVFEDKDSKNKLLLVGDTAQLPPVQQNLSPALDAQKLQKDYFVNVFEFELTEVLRQAQNSGILQNATIIRQTIQRNNFDFQLKTQPFFKDIYRMTNDKLEDGLRYSYKKYGIENTIIICHSNYSAARYNHYIRKKIHFYEEEIEVGDILMIVRNNYYWLPYDSPSGFLANGEFVEVIKVRNLGEEMYEMRFADLTLRLIDYPEQPPFEAKVFLDTLYSPQPNLTQEEVKKLYEKAKAKYSKSTKNRVELFDLIRKDVYLNALQIKFAYALTCHKSQGGQWEAVFVELGYPKKDKLDLNTIRWIYTAMTRATKELFLVNFPIEYFKK
ncbi:MAG: ATP-binding domain-containing protein [Flammeovirgaceae bacterium]